MPTAPEFCELRELDETKNPPYGVLCYTQLRGQPCIPEEELPAGAESLGAICPANLPKLVE